MSRTNKNIRSEDATQRRRVIGQTPGDPPAHQLHGLHSVSIRSSHQRGAVLFVEGQSPRGVYILCAGRAKVSISSAEGKALIMRIAQPGEWLGLSCALSGEPHDSRAETLEACQIDFVSRNDLLKLMDKQARFSFGVAQALAHEVSECTAQARLLFTSNSAAEKLARLVLKWCRESGVQTPRGTRVLFALTHEELSQMIRASRETVTRLLSEFKRRQLITVNGSSILIRKRSVLESMVRLV